MLIDHNGTKVYSIENVASNLLSLVDDLIFGLPSKELFDRSSTLMVRSNRGNLYLLKSRGDGSIPPISDFIIWDKFGHEHDFSVVDHKNVIIGAKCMTTRGRKTLIDIEDLLASI